MLRTALPLLVSTSILVSGCSYPCLERKEARLQSPPEEAVALIDCGAAESSLATLDTQGVKWRYLFGNEHTELYLDFERQEGGGVELTVTLPRELADGTYPANMSLGRLPGSQKHGQLVEVSSGGEVTGTVSFQRTRDYPFVDVEATVGTHSPELVLTLDLSGRRAGLSSCADFRLDAVTLRLVGDLEVATCSLEEARLGGH